MMYLKSLCNRCPPVALSQRECLEKLMATGTYAGLQESSKLFLRKILQGESGIDRRYFATDNLERLSGLDAEALNRMFEKEGNELGSRALAGSLLQGKLNEVEIDALIVCSCTGYLCPGLSSYIAESTGLRKDIQLVDLVGQGCGAALPALRQANALLQAGARHVAVVAVEICSAAFYLEDDAGVIISLCLFGDGASASIWSREESGVCVDGFQTLHWPEHREELRFANAGGKLKNVLARCVPGTAARAVNELYTHCGFEPEAVLAHTGGKAVLQAIREQLPAYDLKESAEVLKRHGNMSSPSVLFVLEEWLKHSDQHCAWMTSFGAGFTCHAARVRRT